MKTISALNQDSELLAPQWNETRRPNSTAFDWFEDDYSVKIITIKLQCPVCGHTWGVRLDDYDAYHQVPDRKFSCQNCRHQAQ
jgi:transposase-like protein